MLEMRILIAVAHADDETLGCFTLLTSGKHEISILHATNSCPLDLKYAIRSGYQTREAYEKGRREEMQAALEAGGLQRSQWRWLDIADQEAPNQIAAIRNAVLEYEVDRIYTHAYEGGHPDHDAVAFALRGLPNVWEFPLYHAWGAAWVPQRFVHGEPLELTKLTRKQQEHKRRMLNCFSSQQRVIGSFPLDEEPARPQPEYDFSKPPHEGQIYYERRKLGWEWMNWRKAVVARA